MEIDKERPQGEAGFGVEKEPEVPKERVEQEKIPAPAKRPLESLAKPERAEEDEIERRPEKVVQDHLDKKPEKVSKEEYEEYEKAIRKIVERIIIESKGKNPGKKVEETVKRVTEDKEENAKSSLRVTLMNQIQQEKNKNL